MNDSSWRGMARRSSEAAGYLALMGLAAFLGFAKGLLFAKVLGAGIYAYYAVLDLVLTFGQVGTVGLLEGLNRDLPLHLGAGRAGRARVLSARGAGAVVTTSLVSLAVYVPIVLLTAPADPLLRLALLAGGVLSAAVNVFLFLCVQLLAHRRSLAFASLLVAKHTLVLVAGVPLGRALGLWGAILAEIGAVVVISAAAVTLFHVLPAIRFGSLNRLRRVLRVGFPLMLGTLVGNLGRSLDRIIVALSLSVAVFGQYSFAMLVGISGLVLWNVLAQYITPRVCHAVGSGAPLGAQRRQLDRLTLVLVGAGLLAYPLFVLALDRFVAPLYPDFHVALGLMKVLYFGAVFQMALVEQAVLVAAGAGGAIFRQAAAVAAFSGVLCTTAWLTGAGALWFAAIYVAHRLLAAVLAILAARRVAP